MTELRSAMNHIGLALWTVVVLLHGTAADAQYPTVLDTTSDSIAPRLLDSPEVGSLQGIQQFGRTLRTDPDKGIGFNYRVLPPVTPKGGMNQEEFLWALVHANEAFELKDGYNELARLLLAREAAARNGDPTESLDQDIVALQAGIARLQLGLRLALGGTSANEYFNRYASGRDTTANLRNLVSPGTAGTFPANTVGRQAGIASAAGAFAPQGIGVGQTLFTGPADGPVTIPEQTLYQQPLIQIKVRLIEASRLNSSDFRSVLDYIDQMGTSGQIVTNNINGNNSTRAATRLPSAAGVVKEGAGGAFSAVTGTGALINLTSEHINFLTSMLVTEFNGDVLAVPEVVTLNGQNVEFVAGDKRPFPLGLTLTQGDGQTRQEFFHKHVGSVLSVTPRIVNWGRHLEGAAEAPIVAQEIANWNRLALWMSDPDRLLAPELQADLGQYNRSGLPLPRTLKTRILEELEKYPAQQLRNLLNQFDAARYQGKIQQISGQSEETVSRSDSSPVLIDQQLPLAAPLVPDFEPLAQEAINVPLPEPQGMAAGRIEQPILRQPSGTACDWKPEDCTIDLEILVRQSNVNSELADKPAENENSIANVVQVKSGHGVVMGGMIATSEVQSVSKVPVLGDLPVVGYAFRAKSIDRAKTELIILVEATVLPPRRDLRDETARDFRLGYEYVRGELRDNPLEIGMRQAGFDQYLPPSGPREDDFWREHENRVRRVTTEVDDIFK